MSVADGLVRVMTDVGDFSRILQRGHALRTYQLTPARAIAASIVEQQGREFVALFSRQSGKDEMLAQLCAWLLMRYRRRGGSVVIALPAIASQGAIAGNRLASRLKANPLTRGYDRSGNSISLGNAAVHFMSASPQAQSRGQTASLLLVANEAQDIDPDLWDARFSPMGASTNASTLYMGTTWDTQGLLSRQLQVLGEVDPDAVFRVPWRKVAAELPDYGKYVERQIAARGPTHPFIQTEYELQELGSAGGLFPPDRMLMMRGTYARIEQPIAGETYAFTIDVAGEAEDQLEGDVVRRTNPRKDSTVLSVWRVKPGQRADLPAYELVCRYRWTGTRHTDLEQRIALLAERWGARAIVIDATGVGTGLASFLLKRLGERRVLPFTFSLASKSRLGWDFVGQIDSGRLTVHAGDDELSRLFWQQADAVRYAILTGPGKLMRWSVPDAALHDDLIISAALAAQLDEADLSPRRAQGRNAN